MYSSWNFISKNSIQLSKNFLSSTSSKKRNVTNLTREPHYPLGEKNPSFSPKVNIVQHGPQVFNFTKLQNGIKVATVNDHLQKGVSIGLFVQSGSRNETSESHGASFFLKRMGFQSTNTRTSLRLCREIENLGATYRVSTSREHMMYASETTPDKIQEIVPILSDVLTPALLDWEVRDEIPHIDHESHQLERDARTVIFDLLHQVGYRNNGLGNALLPPTYNIHHLNSDILTKFVDENYTSERIALVATGNVNHDQFVKLANEKFSSFKSSFNSTKINPHPHQHQQTSSSSSSSSSSSTSTHKSHYVGGDMRLPADGDTHLVLAFEGLPYNNNSKDNHALSVLQFLLGGGTNTQYGIGNGSTSALYRAINESDNNSNNNSNDNHNSNNNNNWLREVSAFNVNYSDSGLFGLYITSERGNTKRLVHSLSNGVKKVLSSDEKSLAGAKNRLKADFYSLNESRNSQMELIANQILYSGKLDSIDTIIKQIDSITMEDVKKVMNTILSTKPTLVALGDVTDIPNADYFVSKMK